MRLLNFGSYWPFLLSHASLASYNPSKKLPQCLLQLLRLCLKVVNRNQENDKAHLTHDLYYYGHREEYGLVLCWFSLSHCLRVKLAIWISPTVLYDRPIKENIGPFHLAVRPRISKSQVQAFISPALWFISALLGCMTWVNFVFWC